LIEETLIYEIYCHFEVDIFVYLSIYFTRLCKPISGQDTFGFQ